MRTYAYYVLCNAVVLFCFASSFRRPEGRVQSTLVSGRLLYKLGHVLRVFCFFAFLSEVSDINLYVFPNKVYLISLKLRKFPGTTLPPHRSCIGKSEQSENTKTRKTTTLQRPSSLCCSKDLPQQGHRHFHAYMICRV